MTDAIAVPNPAGDTRRKKKQAADKAYRLKHGKEINARRAMRRQIPENKAKKAAQDHAYYVRTKTTHYAKHQQWVSAHPAENLAHKASYRAKNRTTLQAKGRTYQAKKRAENPELALQKQRDYSASRPGYYTERMQIWRESHPEENRLILVRYRARKRDLPDTFTLADHVFMLEYWHHACAVCSNQEGFWHTLADDHWIPLNSPDCPGTIAENMLPLCHGKGGCNNSKNDQDPEIWLRSRFGARKARTILKSIAQYFACVRARQSDNEVAS